jgi:ABC-2 type transport system ATP-binding protein
VIVNTAQGNSLNLIVTANSNPLSKIEQTLAESGLPVFSIAQSRPSLDDVYLAATGRTLMDAEIAAASSCDLNEKETSDEGILAGAKGQGRVKLSNRRG